jgi:hypothetical protein
MLASLQACQRIAPYIVVVVLLLIGVFSYYVNTVPLKIETAAATDAPGVPLETDEKIEVPTPNENFEKMEDAVKEESQGDEPAGEL